MKRFLGNALKIGLGIVIGSTMTVFASQLISNVYLNQELKISINGKVQTLTDASTGAREYPLTYRDRTYLPLRSIATLLGYRVGYDATTNTATVDSPDYVAPTATPTPVVTQPSTEPGVTMDVNDIEIIKNLNWQDGPIKDSQSLLNYNYVVSNVINALYMSPETADLNRYVHPETPLRQSLETAIKNIANIRDQYAQKNGRVSLYCSADSVKILKYGYDASGKCKGCLATYNVETSISVNGENSSDVAPYKSVFIFKDANNSELAWVADVIE